jgi:hypothetical protein
MDQQVYNSSTRTQTNSDIRTSSSATGLNKTIRSRGRCLPICDRSHLVPSRSQTQRQEGQPDTTTMQIPRKNLLWNRTELPNLRPRIHGNYERPRTLGPLTPRTERPQNYCHYRSCKPAVLQTPPQDWLPHLQLHCKMRRISNYTHVQTQHY